MKKIIIANWKIYLSLEETVNLAKKAAKMTTPHELVLAPSLLAIPILQKMAIGVKLAAQDVFWGDYGAFTGEVAGRDLKDLGCEYVLIGHSERRKYFAETDETVNKKILYAQKIGLKPVVCVGESAEEQKIGQTVEVIKRQLKIALRGIDNLNLIVAYEPLWAIGTDNPATPATASKIHGMIKDIVGGGLPVIYGGSVDTGNAWEFLSQKNIDGLLVGRASLDPKTFVKIIS